MLMLSLFVEQASCLFIKIVQHMSQNQEIARALVPTMLFWVGTRHCRLLYIIRSVTGIDLNSKEVRSQIPSLHPPPNHNSAYHRGFPPQFGG